MNLTAEQLQANWEKMMSYINDYISSPRKEKLLDFYNKYQERIILMPASHKKEYHNSFPGGYVEHVNRVIECALMLQNVWRQQGADISTYTEEELVFSALNHDLGKMGDENEESYLPQTDQWRRDKLGEQYMFNSRLPFSSVPDRGLFLLQSHGITYTFNEMLVIQTHDGLYDEANKKYLMGYLPEQKPRTCLPYIVHHADMMAARIEFERDWLPKFNGVEKSVEEPKKNFKLDKNNKKTPTKDKALKSVGSNSLKNLLDKI